MCLIFSASVLETATADETFGERYAAKLEAEILKGEGMLKLPA